MVLGMFILDAVLCILRDERIEMHARKDTCSAIITRRFTRCFQGQTLKKTKLGLREPPFLFIVLLGHRHARSIIEGTMSNINFYKAAKRVHHG